MDGGPHQVVQPGETWSPEWTIDQPAASLWYHPHPHEETEDHVEKGLAGMVILSDQREGSLALPRDYGVDDIPVIVQDKRFEEDGAFTTGTRGFIGPIGNTVLVNGTPGAFLDVSTDVVRLRLLNASSAQVYHFAFDDERTFDLIATDGGLLPKPVPMPGIRLSPGERAEVLVSLSPGERVTLRSTPPELGVADPLSTANAGQDSLDVLELRAADALRPLWPTPVALGKVDPLAENDATVTREFTLDGTQINQQEMDLARIDEVVELGSTEIWSVRNGMSMPHSFHVHDVQFQVLSRDGRTPPPELAGWKDTVYLEPEVEYRLIMTFTDYADRNHPYMYHCHLLAHEDSGMMGQFVVVRPGESAGKPPANHDDSAHNDSAHDDSAHAAGTGPRTQGTHHDY
jgi:FtsP/CotA-like multicopper oxidase with cupredoxin domain